MDLEPQPELVHAPFTDEQVVTLNRYQRLGVMHPFTCPMHSKTSLVAQTEGWSCPHSAGFEPIDVRCDYTQDWAHHFMADPESVERLYQESAWMRGAVTGKHHRQQAELIEHASLVEQACEVMHDAYEKAATGAGWETNPASRKPWADVPKANQETMRAAVEALIQWLALRP